MNAVIILNFASINQEGKACSYKMYVWKAIREEDGTWCATETSEARGGAKVFDLANPVENQMVMDIVKNEQVNLPRSRMHKSYGYELGYEVVLVDLEVQNKLK